MNRIVFLDIDGVLQPFTNLKRFDCNLQAVKKEVAKKLNDNSYLDDDGYNIAAVYLDWHQEAISNLKKLLDESKAKIVITSNWRYLGFDYLKRLFKIHGLDKYLLEMTMDYQQFDEKIVAKYKKIEKYSIFIRNRVLEINEYLNNHKVSQFVIIDDIDLSNFFPDHFVRTFVDQKDDFYFSQSNYFEALKILKIISWLKVYFELYSMAV